MAEIVLDRVTKSYPNGATAVKDLSITIADGEFIILVGPSSCGKSTTLNMIACLAEISSGELRVRVRADVGGLQNRLGAATVYVTHAQAEAMTLGDRVVVLLAGVAQQIGTPEELYNSPANLFVAGFIGSPAMNFFPATMTHVGVRLAFGELTLTQEVHDLLALHPRPNNVIVGVS